MKVGIMTYWWSQCNYGQILQNYALQRLLSRAGCEAYTIRYDHRKEKVTLGYIVRNFKTIFINRTRRLLGLSPVLVDADDDNSRGFDQFRAEHLDLSEGEYGSIDELREKAPEADVYICGSDQVWNPGLWGRPYVNRAFFLDFGNDATKRVAFAASVGVKNYPLFMRSRVAQLLQRFDKVTVREHSSKAAIAQFYRKDVQLMPDPTLLLSDADYNDLIGDADFHSGKRYCFVYIIGNNTDLSLFDIKGFAERQNLNVVFCGSGSRSTFSNHKLTIVNWLAAIRNAECVITNSFHGTVFSIVFGRQFYNLPMRSNVKALSSRIDNLLGELKIPSRYMDAESFPEGRIDYGDVSKRLDALRCECSRLMRHLLGKDQEGAAG